MEISDRTKVIRFSKAVDSIPKPQKFPSPFLDHPHPLAHTAATQLMEFLNAHPYWDNIPLYDDLKHHRRIGKMFGVLVVENLESKELGFLAAFSGKLLGQNTYTYFVPPVFDMLDENSFYIEEEQALMALTKTIKELENHSNYHEIQERFERRFILIEESIKASKQQYNLEKQERQKKKQQVKANLIHADVELEVKRLDQEAMQSKYDFKAQKKAYQQELILAREELDAYESKIKALKLKRKLDSQRLQQRLYEQYQFLNTNNEFKDLKAIFNAKEVPPSGSGECAAPKLLNYAFKNNLKPLCMAEFWWGRSPNSNQKVHEQFYPSCEEKCRPILTHMLKGI